MHIIQMISSIQYSSTNVKKIGPGQSSTQDNFCITREDFHTDQGPLHRRSSPFETYQPATVKSIKLAYSQVGQMVGSVNSQRL